MKNIYYSCYFALLVVGCTPLKDIGDIEPAVLTYSIPPKLEFTADSTLILSYAINWDGVEEYMRRKHVLEIAYNGQSCYFFHGASVDFLDTVKVYRKEVVEPRVVDCAKRDSVFWVNSKGEYRHL